MSVNILQITKAEKDTLTMTKLRDPTRRFSTSGGVKTCRDPTRRFSTSAGGKTSTHDTHTTQARKTTRTCRWRLAKAEPVTWLSIPTSWASERRKRSSTGKSHDQDISKDRPVLVLNLRTGTTPLHAGRNLPLVLPWQLSSPELAMMTMVVRSGMN